ncbi:hypothetical protein J2Y45_000945 [Dyadobacter sp. BE34]|uniref:Uncharacterized protein n=1 Tax=Dyadobacter fermentans TaxID=94254 RepID=A0ABU1QSE7_9BACT|nr:MULTISPECIES: hypothetical protein [Dyadobacter]MDR6803675.1 hypothetical protein [Dyadobacter fermentans]MDR7041415.1 hypothetical protein [Dyadobacter sp. BE242]MDR7195819.1 hypothetical protein [Dyadobacter sp. BE34]MDR7213637.1 hypothetical protein [Dyadobacter sp. BE31]MDR7261225.1 hypothetical protein [Dyadobacter sp. BE32]
MRNILLAFLLAISTGLYAQVPVDLKGFDKKSGVQASVRDAMLNIEWPAGNAETGRVSIDLNKTNALIGSLGIGTKEKQYTIARNLDPGIILTVGKRDLVSQNGWNIFFDKTAYLKYQSYVVKLDKTDVKVASNGSRTEITVNGAKAGPFSGSIQFTMYNGSPLMNVAAVMSTNVDSLAVIYDVGLTSREMPWQKLFWADTEDFMRNAEVTKMDTVEMMAVKYRTIIGQGKEGNLAVFPAPHQYFYPLDNCYNLEHIWYGENYRKLLPGFGIGIRHDLLGDRRWVPWFNAPPGTQQRYNFFCLLSREKDGKVLENVKAFTHSDKYEPLPGYYTMSSHFHQEHVDDVLTRKPLPDMPGFVKAFRNTGVNIVHLAEFHGPGSPRGPEAKRWPELKMMFAECARLSGGNFLLLPGEEPNNFFGGHWMNIFPKPVYWLMSREKDQPFVEDHPEYGKVYRIGNKEEMLKLLEMENGLAWTAHARTKGSTGFPDKHKDEAFYKSDHFLGAAWKAMPADLSQPKLGKRVLDLMDDMANWGYKKNVLAEADLFRIEPNYELYGHLNVNYLQLDQLPRFEDGWQPVLDAMRKGKFFVTTGEVLIPAFKVNNAVVGETARPDAKGNVEISLDAKWTFPLNRAEVISGDGKDVFHDIINLNDTQAFGQKSFKFTQNLKGRKWLRVELWDVAANGAFTQIIWLE